MNSTSQPNRDSQPETPAAWVTETTAASFEGDVLQRSHHVPVVVDFWAPWCSPCRLLGPLLEKLAREYAGRFELVKANTDQLPEAAAAFQVESIPAVFGVIDGQIADLFTGAVAERQARLWLDQLLLSRDVLATSRLEASDPAAAAAAYRQIRESSPNEASAAIGLARCLIELQQYDEARAIIEKLAQRGFLEPEAEQVKASLELRARESIDLDACRQAAETAPGDLQVQLKYAEGLAGAHQYQAALELALSLVERDRRGAGEAARQLMVDIFRVLPGDSELVGEYRRRLSMALY